VIERPVPALDALIELTVTEQDIPPVTDKARATWTCCCNSNRP
jgi:hypothetical protein